MSSVFGSLSSTFSGLSWGIQKTARSAYYTGEVYTVAPLGLAAYTGYKALSHLQNALLGKDSFEFRKKLFTEFSSNSELPYMTRISKLSRAVFGSISLPDRASELTSGLGYLAGTGVLIYGLHAYTQKENEFQGRAGPEQTSLPESEARPDSYAFSTINQALDNFGRNIEFSTANINHELYGAQPETPAESRKYVMDMANFIFQPNQPKTPLRSFIFDSFPNASKKVRSFACSYLPFINSTQLCDFNPTLSVDKMSIEELNTTKAQLIDLINKESPTDYKGKSAEFIASVCRFVLDWVPSVDANAKCAGLKEGIHPEVTDQATLAIQRLDLLYDLLTGAYDESISWLSRVDFGNREDLAAILAQNPNKTDQIIPKLQKAFTKIPEETLAHLNKATANFFNISENFTQREIRRAYRKFIKDYHPDKNSDENAPYVFNTGTLLNDFYSPKGDDVETTPRILSIAEHPYEFYAANLTNTAQAKPTSTPHPSPTNSGGTSSLPSLKQVASDFFEGAKRWWNRPIR